MISQRLRKNLRVLLHVALLNHCRKLTALCLVVHLRALSHYFERRCQDLVDCTVESAVYVPPRFCARLEALDVPLSTSPLHELDSVLIARCLLLQVVFVANKDDWDLFRILDLLEPVLGVVEAHLSCKISTQNNSVKRLEVRLDDRAHSLLACCVEDLDFDNLPAVDREPHALDVGADCFRFDGRHFEVFVQKLVDETGLTDVTVADDSYLNHRDVLLLVHPREELVPDFRWL